MIPCCVGEIITDQFHAYAGKIILNRVNSAPACWVLLPAILSFHLNWKAILCWPVESLLFDTVLKMSIVRTKMKLCTVLFSRRYLHRVSEWATGGFMRPRRGGRDNVSKVRPRKSIAVCTARLRLRRMLTWRHTREWLPVFWKAHVRHQCAQCTVWWDQPLPWWPEELPVSTLWVPQRWVRPAECKTTYSCPAHEGGHHGLLSPRCRPSIYPSVSTCNLVYLSSLLRDHFPSAHIMDVWFICGYWPLTH